MASNSETPERHALKPLGAATREVSTEKQTEKITPLNRPTNELREIKEAETAHWVALIRYFGGIGITAIITIAALYVFLFASTGTAYGDAVKLLFLITGAIVGSLYSSNAK